MTRVWGSLVANTVLYFRFSLVTVGYEWTAQIDRESAGLKTAQAGGRFLGRGPGCGLGRGGARARGFLGRVSVSGPKAKSREKKMRSWAALPHRASAAGPPVAAAWAAPRAAGPNGETAQFTQFFHFFSFSRSYY